MERFAFTPDFTGAVPLYQQLYRYASEEIRSGRLCEGDALPSKRALCAHLGVSLSTVESAYGLLCAEGYARSVPRSGYRVCAVTPLPAAAPATEHAHFEEAEVALDPCFSTAAVDASLFPYAAWARLMREAVRDPRLLQRGRSQGDLGLREALCAFLYQYRGVSCRSEQVVVGAGLEYLTGLLLQLLPPEAVVGLEDPGYHAAYRAMEHHRRPSVPVPVDALGLVPGELDALGADVAYVTPSHQYPLGMTMSAPRRAELLRWAYEKPGRYIIEDDYDSEFRTASRPIPAMQGVDRGNRVIYLGTFSRSIAPSIRAAYLILPPALLERYRADFAHGASTMSRYEQRVLEEFLRSGQYVRHLRRTGTLYRAREAALIAALRAHLPEGEIFGDGGGLHLLLTLPGRDEAELVRRGQSAGYELHGRGEYCHAASYPGAALVLGFAGLDAARADAAVAELRAAFDKQNTDSTK